MNTNNHKNQQGAIAIYLAMLIVMILTSGALLMSGILTKQIAFSQDVVTSEQAFYAADSGVEEALYLMVTALSEGNLSPVEVEGEIIYGDEKASYRAQGQIVVSTDQTRSVPCVNSQGRFRNEDRRVRLGAESGVCQ